jgi:predicted alpha/beta hydrolase family esterase
VTALKTFRADLTAHLAVGLGATAPAVGKLVNPPAVVVQASTPYVAAIDYCNDAILFEATIVAPPGDPAAVVDALDDLIDDVRSTLKTPSTAGHRYSFREVSGFTTWPQGDEVLPAVTVTVAVERQTP